MTKEQKQSPLSVGLDIGYSSVKLAYGRDLFPQVVRMPVGAGPLGSCVTSFDGSTVPTGAGHRILIGGQEWVAGVDPGKLNNLVPCMDDRYLTTDEYRALFHAALSEIKETQVDRRGDGASREALPRPGASPRPAVDAGRSALRAQDLVVEVKKVTVVPQPVGAFAAHSLDATADRSKVGPSPGGVVLTVEPGHYSLDWVIYHDGFKMNSAGSTSQAGEVVVQRAAEILSKSAGRPVPVSRLQMAILQPSAMPLKIGAARSTTGLRSSRLRAKSCAQT